MSQTCVLLTGATGYLGSRLLEKLIHDDVKVIVLKRTSSRLTRIAHLAGRYTSFDIDGTSLTTVFENHQIISVLHAAADYGLAGAPAHVVEANLLFPLRLLQLSEAYGVSAFINVGTMLDHRVNAYALSKQQLAQWLPRFSEKIACVEIATTHFFGPGDSRRKLITYLVAELLRFPERIDLSPGEQRRDFIFVDDVVHALVRILDASKEFPPGFHRFELGSGTTISIRELVDKLQQLTCNQKTALHFGALPYRPYEMMDMIANLTPLRQLGWTPQTTLDEGLRAVIFHEQKALY